MLIGFALPGACCARLCQAFGRKEPKRRALLPLLLLLLSLALSAVLTLCAGGSSEAGGLPGGPADGGVGIRLPEDVAAWLKANGIPEK